MVQITVDLLGKRGAVRCSPRWVISVLAAARACPGRNRFVDGVFYFERSKENDEYFESTFARDLSSVENVKVLKEETASEAFMRTARPPFKTNFPPDPAQKEALDRAWKNPTKFAFFEEPGFGKTKVVLDHLVRLWCEDLIDGALILSLNIVHEQWILDEIPKHVHPSIPTRLMIHRTGKAPDREFFRRDSSSFRILAMNHEAYNAKGGSASSVNFMNSGRIACVIDESHVIKTPEAQLTEALQSDSENYAARLIATGGPAPLGLQDYYAQMRFLSWTIIGAKTFTGFKGRYCQMGGWENRQVVGYHNTDELHRRMAPYLHVGAPVIDAEQVFDEYRFNLSPQQRAAYEEFKDTLLLSVGDTELTAATQLAARQKLQQIACGRVLDAEGNVHDLHTERLDLLLSVLKANEGQKAIIWNRFLADMDRQAELLGDKAVVINGKVPVAQRRDILNEFKHGKAIYLIASPGAAGAGIDGLQHHCSLNIYYSNSDNAQHRWQSEARTYRRGATGRKRFIDIVARGTIDVGIARNYRNKKDISTMSKAEFAELIRGD